MDKKTYIPNIVSTTENFTFTNSDTSKLEQEVSEAPATPEKRPFWPRLAAGIFAVYMAIAGVAAQSGCGDDTGNGNQDAGADVYKPDADVSPNNPLAPFDTSSVRPQDGSKIQAGSGPVDVEAKTPGKNPNYTGSTPSGADITVTATGDNATPSDTSDDWTQKVVDKKAQPLETVVNGTFDPMTANKGGELKEGEKVKFEFAASTQGGDGKTYSQKTSTTATYEGANKVRVLGCYVKGAGVGAGLGIDCEGKDPNGKSLMGNWKLTSDLTGAMIYDIDNTHAGITNGGGGLTPSDVGLHTYTVTCGNGTETSAPYSFTVPVDDHDSGLTLKCSDAKVHNLLLPETTVDTVAKQCGSGFNPSLKPSSSTQPDYKLDVTASCVAGAINGLTAAEKKALDNYNLGKTTSTVSSCNPTFAQVVYSSSKK